MGDMQMLHQLIYGTWDFSICPHGVLRDYCIATVSNATVRFILQRRELSSERHRRRRPEDLFMVTELPSSRSKI